MDALISAIFGGFISKVINDITDVSDIKNKIINAVKNKKNKHQSPESQVYNIIVDALNKFTYNEYENNQDKIFSVAEVLFEGFKVGEDEAIKLCFPDLGLDNNENEIQRFKVALCESLAKTEYRELYCAILLLILTKRNQLDITLVEKLDQILKKLNNNNKESNNEKECFKDKPKSRTQDYLDVWNKNMFLNDFTEWDEKQGVNIKLSDVYIKDHLPHFLYGDNSKEFNDVDELLSQHIMKNDNSNKMLLILGQPGIGKSTLITWMLNNFRDRIDDILVYQFVSDLKDVPWENFISSKILLEELGLSYDDLNNKILIIDGFDEIDVKKDRKGILDSIHKDLIYKKNIKNFTLIITCREHYIYDFERLRCKYITLQSWDEKQIESFCKVYCEKSKSEITNDSIKNIINNKDVLGVPLILYMVLALNITLEREGSIVDVYDKIFSLDGGIYDRCIDNRNFAEEHRIGEIKRQIHQVSREIAFWMFENKPEEAFIRQKEYQKICKKVADESENKSLEQDFIIGNFYRLKHCEGIGINKLYFVHRTIYEYFVVEYMFSCMYEAMKKSKEELASVFGYFLKKGRLSKTIYEFLKYKIQNSQLKNKYNTIFNTFNLMLKDGMTYYTNRCYKNVIDCEMNVFTNMLEIIHLWDVKAFIFNNLSKYLVYNKNAGLDLRCMNLNSINLIEVNLEGADLEGADLTRANLEGANLSGTYFKVAYLAGANLNKANLRGANLEGADLTGVNLTEVNLTRTHLVGINLTEANLIEVNLTEVNLIGVNLEGADLRKANLKGADLRQANLGEVNLAGANLTEAVFDEKQIECLEKKYDLSKVSVCLKPEEIISYKDYKKR